MLLIVLMIAATMWCRRESFPAMERDRAAAGGDINALPTDNSVRAHFDRLHGVSEKVEGSALFLGIGVVVLIAAEPSAARKTDSAG